MNRFLFCILLAAATFLAGCYFGPAPTGSCGTATQSSAGWSLGDLIIPSRPVAFCEGTTVVCPAGWNVCDGTAPERYVTLPASVLGVKEPTISPTCAEVEPDADAIPEGAVVLKKTVTTYKGGEAKTVEVPCK